MSSDTQTLAIPVISCLVTCCVLDFIENLSINGRTANKSRVAHIHIDPGLVITCRDTLENVLSKQPVVLCACKVATTFNLPRTLSTSRVHPLQWQKGKKLPLSLYTYREIVFKLATKSVSLLQC